MSPQMPSLARRGLRLGGRIAACLLAGLVAIPFASAEEPWKTEDIIDPRIDEDAQYGLMRMLSGDDVGAASEASAMLSAIKNGDLAGIYQADRQAPALRVRALGSNWWEIIPRGADAICLTKPSDSKPMIIYRKGIGATPRRIDPALLEAWPSCGVASAPPRPYVVTIVKPPPSPAPPAGDVPPPFEAALTVMVTSDGKALPGAAVGIVELQSGASDSGTTDASGMVPFHPSSGLVGVWAYGPTTAYAQEYREIVIASGTSQTIIIDLEKETAQVEKPACDKNKFNEVFNPCGRAVLGAATSCLKDAYLGYAKCKSDPVCAGKAALKFLECRNELDHKRKIQECTDKANAASGCNFPGP